MRRSESLALTQLLLVFQLMSARVITSCPYAHNHHPAADRGGQQASPAPPLGG
jgi:hypothetical protein